MNPSDCKVHGHQHKLSSPTQSRRTESDQTALKSSTDKQRSSPSQTPQRPLSAARNTNGRESQEEENCSESHRSAIDNEFLPSPVIAGDDGVSDHVTAPEVMTENLVATIEKRVDEDHLASFANDTTDSFDQSTAALGDGMVSEPPAAADTRSDPAELDDEQPTECHSEDADSPDRQQEKIADQLTDDCRENFVEADRRTQNIKAAYDHVCDEGLTENMTGDFHETFVEAGRRNDDNNAKPTDRNNHNLYDEMTGDFCETVIFVNRLPEAHNAENNEHEELSTLATGDFSDTVVDESRLVGVNDAEVTNRDESAEKVTSVCRETLVDEDRLADVNNAEKTDREQRAHEVTYGFRQTVDVGRVNHAENEETAEGMREEKHEEVAKHIAGDVADFPDGNIEIKRFPLAHVEQNTDDLDAEIVEDVSGGFHAAVILGLRIFVADGARGFDAAANMEDVAERVAEDLPDVAAGADRFSASRDDIDDMADYNDGIAEPASGDAFDNHVDADRLSLVAAVRHAKETDHTPEEPAEQAIGDVQDYLVDIDRSSVVSQSDYAEANDRAGAMSDSFDADRLSVARSDGDEINGFEPVDGDLPDRMIDDDFSTTADHSDGTVEPTADDLPDSPVNTEPLFVVRSAANDASISGDETAEQTPEDYPDKTEDNGGCVDVIRSDVPDTGNQDDWGRFFTVRSDNADSEDLSACPIDCGRIDANHSESPTFIEDEIADPELATGVLPDGPVDVGTYATSRGFVDLNPQHYAQAFDDGIDEIGDAETQRKSGLIGNSAGDDSNEAVESSIKNSPSRIIYVECHAVGDDGRVGNTNNSNDDDDGDRKKKSDEQATEPSNADGSGGAGGTGGELGQSSTTSGSRMHPDVVSPEPPESCTEDEVPEYQLPNSTRVDNGDCSRDGGDGRCHRCVIQSPCGLVNRALVTVVKHGEQDSVDADRTADGLTKADI